MPITISGVTFLTAQDDIYAANLTAKSPITGAVFDGYFGYVNGNWPDAKPDTPGDIQAKFPGKPVEALSTFLANVGDGEDIEEGDATPAQAVTYYNERKAAGDTDRPILYAGADDMNTVIDDLEAAKIPLGNVRLVSAHYGWKSADHVFLANRHICGPETCGLVKVDVDGTQWCNTATWDESLLRADFYDAAPVAPSTPTPPPVAVAPVITQIVSARMNIRPSGTEVVDILEHGTTVAYLWDDGSIWQTGLNVAPGEPICPKGQGYWLDGDGTPRVAAQLEPFGVNGYEVIATDGGRYNYGS